MWGTWMQAIILCGGLSTRLGSLSEGIPKVLLKIGEKTILQHQMELLEEAGVTEVLLATGHLHEQIHAEIGEHFGDISVRYLYEEQPLGTGGALQNALAHVKQWPVFVLNGDILYDGDLLRLTKQMTPQMDGLILGVEVPDARSFGRLIYQEATFQIEAFVEKDPEYYGAGFINGGIYLLNPSIQNYFPEKQKFSIEYDVFPFVKQLYVHLYIGSWIEVGTPERLDFARNYMPHIVQRPRSKAKSPQT